MMFNKISFFGDFAYSPSSLEFNIDMNCHVHVNLEAPIVTSNTNQATKVGPTLSQTPDLLVSDRFSNFSFSLANNHIMDYGEYGLIETINLLGKNRVVGAGITVENARTPLIISLNDGENVTKIAIISCSDRFFGEANNTSAGIAVASLGSRWVDDQIVWLRSQGINPIISHHGGIEDFALPSPILQEKFYRWIECGAELVIGHHPHIPLPHEEYKGKMIYYGLGNFVVNTSIWGKKHSMELISRRVNLEVYSSNISVGSEFVQISKVNGDKHVVHSLSNLLEDNLIKELDLIGTRFKNTIEYDELYQAISEYFVYGFVKRQLLFGTFGLFIKQNLRLLNSLKSNKLVNKNYCLKKLLNRILSAFGPHYFDLFASEVTSDLIMQSQLSLLKRPHRDQKWNQKQIRFLSLKKFKT